MWPHKKAIPFLETIFPAGNSLRASQSQPEPVSGNPALKLDDNGEKI